MKELVSKLENILAELEKQKRREAKTSDKKFWALASTLNFPVFVISEKGGVDYYNEAATNIFHSFESGGDYSAILKHFSQTATYFRFEKALEDFFGGQLERYSIKDFDLSLINKDGKTEEVKVSLNFFSDNQKDICLAVTFPKEIHKRDPSYFRLSPEIVREISKLEEKTKKLVLHTEYLKETNSTKDKFFNIIAHDLRAPFNAILGLAEMLKSDAENMSAKEISEIASRVYSASKNSLEMVEDLLDWARLQNNSIEYYPEKFHIEDIIIDILFIMKNSALKKKIQLKTKIEKKLQVYADKNMVSLILRNLISNAIKFTKHGGEIEIIAKSIADDFAMLTVKDNGVGINREDIEKILKVEEHYSTLGTEKEKGTGLGLVLCKEFISKNNGELIIESELGKGSEISVTIPKVKD